MSTIKSDTSRFNILLPLFQFNGTLANATTNNAVPVTDNRPRLYLGALSEELKKLKTRFNHSDAVRGLRLTAEMPELQNQYFKLRDHGADEEAIHSEWEQFGADMLKAFNNGSGTLITNPTLLAIVKSLAGTVHADSHTKFLQEIIKLHFNLGKAKSPPTSGWDDITGKPDEWGNVTAIKMNIGDANKGVTFILAVLGGRIAGTISNATDFSYNINKFLLHLKLEAVANAPTGAGDSFWTDDDEVDNTYYRLASDKSKLYKTDANGNKVEVTKGSAHYNDKFQEDGTCASHYVANSSTNGSTVNTCTNYLKQCIISGDPSDIKACKEFMKDHNFWTATKKEVNEMLPTNIEDTLKQFGFQTETRDNLIEFESIGSWFRNLESQVPKGHLTADELTAIKDNGKLKSYLTMLLEKMSKNPAILNTDYNARYNYDADDHKSYFKDWRLRKILQPRLELSSDDSSGLTRLANVAIANFTNTANISRHRVSVGPTGNVMVLGAPYYPAVLGMSIRMSGGSGESDDMFGGNHTLSNYNQNQLKENYSLLKMMFDSVENKLQNKGKALDSTTKAKLTEHLEKYKQTEAKLFKAIRYADKYIDLIELYGHYDTDKVLSIDHLKKFVEARDTYLNKANGKQNDILSAIEQFTRIVIDAVHKK